MIIGSMAIDTEVRCYIQNKSDKKTKNRKGRTHRVRIRFVATSSLACPFAIEHANQSPTEASRVGVRYP